MSYTNRKFSWDFNALHRFYNNYVVKWLNSALSWTAAQKKQARANLGFGDGDIDNAPTANSSNVVTSGGVYTELAKYRELESINLDDTGMLKANYYTIVEDE